MGIIRPGTYSWTPGGALAIPAAGTYQTSVLDDMKGMASITWYVNFVRTSGGTTFKANLQISPDGGTTWRAIANHAFATTSAEKWHHIVNTVALTAGTPAATIADNTIVAGITGDRLRVEYIIVGTYVGTFQTSVIVS